MNQGGVSLWVREELCADHPGEAWLTLSIEGHVILETCTAALKAMALVMRGNDLIQMPSLPHAASAADIAQRGEKDA